MAIQIREELDLGGERLKLSKVFSDMSKEDFILFVQKIYDAGWRDAESKIFDSATRYDRSDKNAMFSLALSAIKVDW